MPYNPSFLIKRLTYKFHFEPAPDKDSDHYWFSLSLPGIRPIMTKVSRHKKDVGNVLIGMMARQLRVTSPIFKEMMDCTKSEEEYRKIIQSNPDLKSKPTK